MGGRETSGGSSQTSKREAAGQRSPYGGREGEREREGAPTVPGGEKLGDFSGEVPGKLDSPDVSNRCQG